MVGCKMVETKWIRDPRGLMECRVVAPEFLALIVIWVEGKDIKGVYSGPYPWWFRFLPGDKYPWWYRTALKFFGARIEYRDPRGPGREGGNDDR